ncbi:hypothetical protein JKP88DRAFT_289283 [Tribonema minus]|uniref:Uncharacterized protein n=1 Tax=Tribonema minus TaxID=303371 RepID=A0A835ZAM6_9STRA|nr:hypothetical protein JKP88DRAFT_289283 [Tribonema minus]
MATITNSGADASNFFLTNGGGTITTAEIETRIARGDKPTMEAPPDKRAKLALSVAQDAKRGTKPVLTRDLWKTSKRYVDQNVGNVAGNLTVGGTAAVTGGCTLSGVVFGTTVGAPGTAAGTRIVLYPMVAVATFLPGATYATTGTVSISSASYVIPVSAINTVISGTGSIGTGDSAERLLYGLLQVLYTKNQAGTTGQPQLGCEVANKNITKGVWETTTNVFANVNLVNFLVSNNFGTNALGEDPSNLQVV